MRKSYFILIAIVVAVSYSLFTFASMRVQPVETIKHGLHEPRKVIDMFNKAVDRGELIVFGNELERSVLIPLRVEYIYELNDSKPLVKVYSEIKKIIPIPEHEGIQIRGISAILDSDGHIVEIRVHVFQ